jgi:hypothetical protein
VEVEETNSEAAEETPAENVKEPVEKEEAKE